MTKRESLERAFLQAMPDYMKSHWGVNEEKIIFDFIRSWALGCVPKDYTNKEDFPFERGFNYSNRETRKKIEEELEK